jgi:hypothetical protein
VRALIPNVTAYAPDALAVGAAAGVAAGAAGCALGVLGCVAVFCAVAAWLLLAPPDCKPAQPLNMSEAMRTRMDDDRYLLTMALS